MGDPVVGAEPFEGVGGSRDDTTERAADGHGAIPSG